MFTRSGFLGGSLLPLVLACAGFASTVSARSTGDPTEAPAELQQLARAARAGDKQAQFELGRRYDCGDGVVADTKRAAELYGAAAQSSKGIEFLSNPGGTPAGIPIVHGAPRPAHPGAGLALQRLQTEGPGGLNCGVRKPQRPRTKGSSAFERARALMLSGRRVTMAEMIAATAPERPPASAPATPVPAPTLPAWSRELRDCPECPPMVSVPPVGKTELAPGDAPLWVARHELTWGEYMVAMREAGCAAPAQEDRTEPLNVALIPADDRYPVDELPLPAFQCYLGWLKRRTGFDYRLPRPEEWEHAARAGATTRFPWGDEWGFQNASVNGRYDPAAIPGRRPFNPAREERLAVRTDVIQEVEMFPPNRWGLYDVVGNVSESVGEVREGAPDCIGRADRRRCMEMEVRGYNSFHHPTRNNPLTDKLLRYANMSSASVGYRIVREGTARSP